MLRQRSHLAILCCVLLLAACGPAAVPAASPAPSVTVVSAATTPPAPTRTAASPVATATPAGPSPEALAYLTEALDYIQAHALRRDRVDWSAVRREALTRAQGAQTSWDTYPAIRYALAQLRDDHSHLLEPWVVRGLEGRVVQAKPDGQRLAGAIGYLFLPELITLREDQAEGYAAAAVRVIEEVDREPACGWVVDLRRNEGGDMWAMLAGVGPILGEGDAGAFVDPDGPREVWGYRDGQALAGGQVQAQGPAYHLKRPLPLVAVLTGPRTASSGEAIAVAFRGRPQARSFGEPTAGVPTANDRKELSDGAWLLLTVARMADRTGQTYEDRIVPDQPVAVAGDPPEWQLRDPQRDPVLRAALAWLRDQPDCAGQAERLSQRG